MVLPLLAGIGLVPLSAANAASLRHLPRWEKLTTAWAALMGPTPYRFIRPGAMSLTMASSWARFSFSSRAAWFSASARRRISAWRTA